MRTVVIILVIFNVALGIALKLTGSGRTESAAPQMLNEEGIRLVPMLRDVVVPTRCVELGPFTVQEALSARRMLDEMSLGNRVSSVDVPVGQGWLVYIPPRPNHAEALKRAKELDKLGVREYYVFEDGSSMQHAISLGLFKSEAAAEKYLEEVSKKGVKSARIGKQEQRGSLTLFYMTDPGIDVITRLTEVKAQFARAELKQVSCPSISNERRTGPTN